MALSQVPLLDDGLAPWSARAATSRGRLYSEIPHRFRGEFQRDRDRVIHSTAFRRLVYKTQVFVNHEGDLYRTRLTHSLEVSQIARTVAAALGLNERLTEAICLAHDLGHTPFGHAGQDALNTCMVPWGGFEHNYQSLRVVDELEEKYADFPGLNLTFESREGILKHCSRRNARNLGELGRRFLQRTQAGLEAQLANLADEIAYNNHDVDDGLRSGLIQLDELDQVDLFRDVRRRLAKKHPGLRDRRLNHEIVRGMIDQVVSDLLQQSLENLLAAMPRDIEEVRSAGMELIGFSSDTAARHLALKQFLRDGLYRHERVVAMSDRAHRIIEFLFSTYMDAPERMSEDHAKRARHWESDKGDSGKARAVADYIAGMTDRYAFQVFQKLGGTDAAASA